MVSLGGVEDAHARVPYPRALQLRVLSAVRVVLTAVRPLRVLAVACVLCVLVCPAVLLCCFFFVWSATTALIFLVT